MAKSLIEKYANAFCKIRELPKDELDKVQLSDTTLWINNCLKSIDYEDPNKTIQLAENLIQHSYLLLKANLLLRANKLPTGEVIRYKKKARVKSSLYFLQLKSRKY